MPSAALSTALLLNSAGHTSVRDEKKRRWLKQIEFDAEHNVHLLLLEEGRHSARTLVASVPNAGPF